MGEQSDFAKDCRKKGGVFKCCVSTLHLDTFELTRQSLKKLGLVQSASNLCDKRENCIVCTATYMCTYMSVDRMTIVTQFKTAFNQTAGGFTLFNTHNKDGATYMIKLMPAPTTFSDSNILRPGFRASFCARMDFCQENDLEFFELEQYLVANDEKSFCNVDSKNIDSYSQKERSNTKLSDDCLKRADTKKSINVRICPKKSIKNNVVLKRINKKLNRAWKKSNKKKKRKKKNRSKKKKRKKKNRKTKVRKSKKGRRKRRKKRHRHKSHEH